MITGRYITQMSILEIVLYVGLAVALITYITIMIVKMKKKGKKPDGKDKEEEE